MSERVQELKCVCMNLNMLQCVHSHLNYHLITGDG